MLNTYEWPGNVRKLENTLSYCAMMARSDVIEVRHVPNSLRANLELADAESGGALPTLDEYNGRTSEKSSIA